MILTQLNSLAIYIHNRTWMICSKVSENQVHQTNYGNLLELETLDIYKTNNKILNKMHKP